MKQLLLIAIFAIVCAGSAQTQKAKSAIQPEPHVLINSPLGIRDLTPLFVDGKGVYQDFAIVFATYEGDEYHCRLTIKQVEIVAPGDSYACPTGWRKDPKETR